MASDRLRQRGEVISPLQTGDDSSLTICLRERSDDFGHLRKTGFGDLQTGKRIIPMRIKSGRDEDEIGLERRQRRRHHLLESVENVEISGPLFKRAIQREALPRPLSSLLFGAGAGIKRILVGAEIKNGRVRIEESLRAVPMVNIPIEDEDPF